MQWLYHSLQCLYHSLFHRRTPYARLLQAMLFAQHVRPDTSSFSQSQFNYGLQSNNGPSLASAAACYIPVGRGLPVKSGRKSRKRSNRVYGQLKAGYDNMQTSSNKQKVKIVEKPVYVPVPIKKDKKKKKKSKCRFATP